MVLLGANRNNNQSLYFGSKVVGDEVHLLELHHPVNGCSHIGWIPGDGLTQKFPLVSPTPSKHRSFITYELQCEGLQQGFSIKKTDREIIDSLSVKEIMHMENSAGLPMLSNKDFDLVKNALLENGVLVNAAKIRSLSALFIRFQAVITQLEITYSILSVPPYVEISTAIEGTGHFSEMADGSFGVEFIHNNELHIVSLLDESKIENSKGCAVPLQLPSGAVTDLLNKADPEELEAVTNYVFLKKEVITTMLKAFFDEVHLAMT